jgi:hypothetical protein
MRRLGLFGGWGIIFTPRITRRLSRIDILAHVLALEVTDDELLFTDGRNREPSVISDGVAQPGIRPSVVCDYGRLAFVYRTLASDARE